MKVQDIELAQAIVEHVDTHLHERMTLDDLVAATHYSKFHLHRAFTTVLGLPVHTYVQRRRLSEAASLLVHSRWSILDIALLSGYQSQQAFSVAFKSLYKQAPGAFRRRADAYPLQCRVSLYVHLAAPIVERQQVRLANDADVPALLALMKAAIDGYPEMDEGAFRRPDDSFRPVAVRLDDYLLTMFFYGVAMTMVQVTLTTLFQESVAPDEQGRLFGLLGSIYAGALSFGMVAFGALADGVSLRGIMVVSGLAVLLAAGQTRRMFSQQR